MLEIKGIYFLQIHVIINKKEHIFRFTKWII